MPTPPLLERTLPLLEQEDDDDMDYEPASEDHEDPSVEEEYDDEEEDSDDDDEDDDDEYEDDEGTEYIDAEEEITVEELLEELTAEADDGDLQHTQGENEEGGTNTAGAQTAAAAPAARAAPMTITRAELLQLLAQSGAFRRFWHAAPDAASGTESGFTGRRQRRRADPPKVPSDEGRALMESGTFGTNERSQGRYARKKKLASRIMRRELGLESSGKQRSCNRIASQGLIPSSEADTIIHYDNKCYSGQFSEDGNFFFSCSQDFNVRMYDTSNPYKWRHYRTVNYPFGQWTITDASLSPDNKFLAYSSIKSTVCLAHTDPESTSEPYLLDFSDMGQRPGRPSGHGRNHFGIWSIRFSGDGSEIVAGTSDNSVYVYDLETRQSVLKIRGHFDDVNAVCYGDKSSPHILYSGSDDSTIKVWDRRSLGDSRAAGLFLGHTEGITYVDSKGDGRYVLSNGKDQTMKLWDLRKMVSTEQAEQDPQSHSTGFDYRFEPYRIEYNPHPNDCSIVTFRGHRVLKTLIRCHFSPPGSTDSRYVYTGSEDGSVYIYNMDATIAGKLDVQKTTENTRPRGNEDMDEYYFDDRGGGQSWKTCVRDASWHPNAPVIAATSWNGHGMMHGTCTVHTWNDGLDEDEAEPPMRHRVNAELRDDRRLYEANPSRPRRTMRARRRAEDGDE